MPQTISSATQFDAASTLKNLVDIVGKSECIQPMNQILVYIVKGDVLAKDRFLRWSRQVLYCSSGKCYKWLWQQIAVIIMQAANTADSRVVRTPFGDDYDRPGNFDQHPTFKRYSAHQRC